MFNNEYIGFFDGFCLPTKSIFPFALESIVLYVARIATGLRILPTSQFSDAFLIPSFQSLVLLFVCVYKFSLFPRHPHKMNRDPVEPSGSHDNDVFLLISSVYGILLLLLFLLSLSLG